MATETKLNKGIKTMYDLEEVMEIVMDSDCNDLTISDCFKEEEVIEVINDLTNKSIIGEDEPNEEGFILYDDGDIDIIIDNLN